MPDRPERRDKPTQDELVRRILEQILGSERLRESSVLSERTYTGEPILRTGSDLRREREGAARGEGDAGTAGATGNDASTAHKAPATGRPGAGRAPATAQPPSGDRRTHHREAIASTRRARARRSYETQASDPGLYDRVPTMGTKVFGGSGRGDPDQGLWDFLGSLGVVVEHVEPLPETLRQLRELEHARDDDGSPLRGTRLFVRQAQVAADYEDRSRAPLVPAYQYFPSYQILSDEELVSYFRWRTRWRAGDTEDVPASFAAILASELVNGVGATEGEPALAELQRLARAYGGPNASALEGYGLKRDLHRWVLDYVAYHGLDPRSVVTDDERAWGETVCTLRLAERDVLAREGLRGLTLADAPAEPPTDEQVWKALCALSTSDTSRSPFFRTHPEEAAAVGAEVFRRLASHCARRRKVCLVDGLVGEEESHAYTPFLGLAFEDQGHDDVLVRLMPGRTLSHRLGRWHLHQAWSSRERSRDVARLLRGIDRQMRIDWDFGRPLKEAGLPKYQQTMVAKASAAVRERQQEEERRRITIDLSQLDRIRAAAATTREALLVDEEREGFGEGAAGTVATARDTPPTDAAGVAPTTAGTPASETPVPESPATPQPAASQGDTGSSARGQVPPPTTQDSDPATEGSPLGLSDIERELLRRLLDGTPTADLFGPGTPMESVVVDALNERLFDEVGDAVVEFGDDGHPRLVEDYEADVRTLLGD